jgi:flagellar biosynthesis protein FlhF
VRVFGERLHLEVRKRIRVTGGIAMSAGIRRVIALAGPTGVGKTTNVAKLAAHFAIAERARVGLVTSDTYRIAATDQLKIYADIIGIPLTIVNDSREAAAALRGMTEFDAVFVDTAGGSPYNSQQLDDARDLLRAIRPDEVMLVLSASTPLDDMRAIVSRFSALRPTSLFFTKLDETRCAGSVFCLAEQSGLPLSYFSIGQNVPDDIEVAQARTLAKRLLEGSSHRD